ncbi:MAG: hypothetical protein K0R26_1927 [Bacteroidota bacterium]|jgi:hypothetical protein|nr:hypothetical protein [Bacteroidota bacterium]
MTNPSTKKPQDTVIIQKDINNPSVQLKEVETPIKEMCGGYSKENNGIDYVTVYFNDDFILRMNIQDAINLQRMITRSLKEIISNP